MPIQDQLIMTTLETIYRHGLAGVQNEEGLTLLARKYLIHNHPLLQDRIGQIRSSQMTEVDDSSYQDEFPDSNDKLLFHTQSQIVPENNNANWDSGAHAQSPPNQEQDQFSDTDKLLLHAKSQIAPEDAQTGEVPGTSSSPGNQGFVEAHLGPDLIDLQPASLQNSINGVSEFAAFFQGSDNPVIYPENSPFLYRQRKRPFFTSRSFTTTKLGIPTHLAS